MLICEEVLYECVGIKNILFSYNVLRYAIQKKQSALLQCSPDTEYAPGQLQQDWETFRDIQEELPMGARVSSSFGRTPHKEFGVIDKDLSLVWIIRLFCLGSSGLECTVLLWCLVKFDQI